MTRFKNISLLILLLVLSFGFAQSQSVSISEYSPNPVSQSGKIVMATCFGDCGGSSQLMYFVKSTEARGLSQYEVICTSNTLCGNLSTIGRVYVNGSLVKTFDFTYPGSGGSFYAKNGDMVLIEASPEDTDINASCTTQGSFSYKLIQK